MTDNDWHTDTPWPDPWEEKEDEGDAIRPAYADGWDDIEARRSLGHIVGFIDIDVPDLVDIVIDTINKEL